MGIDLKLIDSGNKPLKLENLFENIDLFPKDAFENCSSLYNSLNNKVEELNKTSEERIFSIEYISKKLHCLYNINEEGVEFKYNKELELFKVLETCYLTAEPLTENNLRLYLDVVNILTTFTTEIYTEDQYSIEKGTKKFSCLLQKMKEKISGLNDFGKRSYLNRIKTIGLEYSEDDPLGNALNL